MTSFASKHSGIAKRAQRVASRGCVGLISALLFSAPMFCPRLALPADLTFPVTGNLLGSVVDAEGIPQLGASVQLLNKYERQMAKTVTSMDGRFAFASLPADVYSIRVSLASFLPAARNRIAVKAGLDSVLQIHMATLFSKVELSYSIPDGAMSDDWKWVLRSSPATRPITRYLPVTATDPVNAELRPHIFSGTHAVLSLSGGDGGLIESDSNGSDFGTGFALSTNVMGKNQVQLGGTLGQSSGFGPGAFGLCAIYSRDSDAGLSEPPEITMTLTQLGVAGAQLPGVQSVSSGIGLGTAAAIRTMSLGIYEVIDPVDSVHVEYGVTGESVDYLQHTSRISPFARVTIGLGRAGEVVAAYSDGGRPDELTAHQEQGASEAEVTATSDDLVDAVNSLARVPQLSERNGRLELQRTQNYEIGYRKETGATTLAISGFYEDVSNGRINVAGDVGALDSENLFSDDLSNTSTYNIGNYRREGYVASVRRRMTQSLDLAIAYGRMGGFTPDAAGVSQGSQRFLEQGDRNLASANVEARIPRAGTKISANYGWMDSGAIVPRHVFTTQNIYVAPGLNIDIRQPLPAPFGIPGHLELTANVRNLLAQGYLPFDEGEGRQLLIVQSPRAIRGGLNFIF